MTWNPVQYERFADHRLRPGLDLLSRIPPIEPSTIVDLGCGTGTLTEMLARRWPPARTIGLDASPDMLARVPDAGPPIVWALGDIARWQPDEPCDLIFSNAALHWLGDHEALFARLVAALAPGGVLAVQMPGNWAEPSHRIPAAVLDEGDFSDESRRALLRDPVATPAEYRRWLGPGLEVDMWTTTYYQFLRGPDPILEWVKGTVLPPVVRTMDEERASTLVDECARRYRAAYPPEPDGTTVLPFRRLFMVARRSE